jgi:hypothetical protein
MAPPELLEICVISIMHHGDGGAELGSLAGL